MSKNYLNTTTRNVAWFKGAFERGELNMKPIFQRNPVWTNKQKSYLIDTILTGYPIPEVYMQETVDSKGNPIYTIVDGQQRTRAILEYFEGKFSINAEESPNYADLAFEDLSGDQKITFFQYNFVIRLLPDIGEEELRSIFQRLNKNVVSLNRQELRNATYWGPFITTMKVISDKSYWKKLELFTATDIRRMMDVEFISELSIFVLHDFQNKKDNLDKYYQLYEEEFESADQIITIFDTVNYELLQILPNISSTRWSTKSDYYTLFGYFAKYFSQFPLAKEDREFARIRLLEFGYQLDEFVKTDHIQETLFPNHAVREYVRGIRATTDIKSRKVRESGLAMVIGSIWDEDNESAENTPPLPIDE